MINKKSEITYNCIVNKYLNFHDDDIEAVLTNEGLHEFLDALKKAGYKDNSRRLYYWAIHNFIKKHGDSDVVLDNPPKINDLNVYCPYYKEDEIQNIIYEAKRLGGIYSKSMAISTIYGVRRVELSNIKLEDIDLNNKTIKIWTAKRGKPTQHLIPEKIVPYLTNTIEMLGLSSMTRIFNRLTENIGLKKPGNGWHSIRRALVTGLIDNGVSDDDVQRFMRWSKKNIVNRYYFYGTKKDKAIFEKHPFLKYW